MEGSSAPENADIKRPLWVMKTSSSGPVWEDQAEEPNLQEQLKSHPAGVDMVAMEMPATVNASENKSDTSCFSFTC